MLTTTNFPPMAPEIVNHYYMRITMSLNVYLLSPFISLSAFDDRNNNNNCAGEKGKKGSDDDKATPFFRAIKCLSKRLIL